MLHLNEEIREVNYKLESLLNVFLAINAFMLLFYLNY